MMKRLLSLVLSLVMVLGLFAGLAGSASADGEIGQLFDRYLTGDKIEEFFDGFDAGVPEGREQWRVHCR